MKKELCFLTPTALIVQRAVNMSQIIELSLAVEAKIYLCEVDPILSNLIAKHGKCPLLRSSGNPYGTLLRSIISQQLSVKAANTIERRVIALVKDFSPENILEIPVSGLREAGLSGAKARSILELSARVVDGRINFRDLINMSNEEAIVILSDLPGIGRWTAEMFLIFGLGRPDVWSLGDAGLKRAVKSLYGETAAFEKIGDSWKPYRSVASWYLWKFLDG